ncbi:alpha/beta hydrolase, partial [Sphingomonas bacterium]|uniref:alpha/beta hydrolase n=1 Tax=Sphingomonas bacterium TaxID=1895847 RepID=UPI001C2DCAA6
AAMTRLGLENADPQVAVSDHLAPGHDGAPDVRVRLYRPEGLPAHAPIVMHIHGGGFLFGSAELGDPRNRAWAKALDAALVSIDYRLAPEHPYPAALDDCYAVLEWLHAEGPALGLDSNRIAVRGESAGGGLAAALCLLARDRGGPKIAYQLLIYPMLDDRTGTTGERNPFSGQFVWDAASNAYGWSSWLGRPAGSDEIPYLAAPARATDLAGLPPTMIATAALDIFIDENLDYAIRLIRAGVPTEVHVAPGAFHGFEAMVPNAQVSRTFTERCLDGLRRAFAA